MNRCAAALCNVDFFVNIISKVGNSEADKILTRISSFFSSYKEFKTYKHCGDSYILIFNNIDNTFDDNGLFLFVDELRKKFKRQKFISQSSVYADVPITVSIGLAAQDGSEDSTEMENLLRKTEIALAEAKKKGRNKVVMLRGYNIRTVTHKTDGVYTLVGGRLGYNGDGLKAQDAKINGPYGVDVTDNGGILVADRGNHVIRLIDHNGTISTVAGNGQHSYSGDGGCAKKARLSKPSGVVSGFDGCYYIADTGNHCVRKVDAHGVISTLGKDTDFNRPGGVAVDIHGNVYTNDYGNNVIKVIKRDGSTHIVAGSGKYGYSGDGGMPLRAALDKPYGLAVSKDGRFVYIADYGNNCIREVDIRADKIRTVCGTGDAGFSGDGEDGRRAMINGPYWVYCYGDRYLLIADALNSRIRILNLRTNIIDTLTGNGQCGYVDCDADNGLAEYNIPAGLAVDYRENVLYIADFANNAVRACNIKKCYANIHY